MRQLDVERAVWGWRWPAGPADKLRPCWRLSTRSRTSLSGAVLKKLTKRASEGGGPAALCPRPTAQSTACRHTPPTTPPPAKPPPSPARPSPARATTPTRPAYRGVPTIRRPTACVASASYVRSACNATVVRRRRHPKPNATDEYARRHRRHDRLLHLHRRHLRHHHPALRRHRRHHHRHHHRRPRRPRRPRRHLHHPHHPHRRHRRHRRSSSAPTTTFASNWHPPP